MIQFVFVNFVNFFICFLFICRTDLRVDLSRMSRTCYRYKSCEYPPSPRTAEDVKNAFEVDDIMRRFGMSSVQENEAPTAFYRGTHVCDDFAYTVFASQGIIDLIEKNIAVDRRKYLMDATFKICPLGEFKQFLVIQIEYVDEVDILNFISCAFLFYSHLFCVSRRYRLYLR